MEDWEGGRVEGWKGDWRFTFFRSTLPFFHSPNLPPSQSSTLPIFHPSSLPIFHPSSLQ
jgi:hypothetical protein